MALYFVNCNGFFIVFCILQITNCKVMTKVIELQSLSIGGTMFILNSSTNMEEAENQINERQPAINEFIKASVAHFADDREEELKTIYMLLSAVEGAFAYEQVTVGMIPLSTITASGKAHLERQHFYNGQPHEAPQVAFGTLPDDYPQVNIMLFVETFSRSKKEIDEVRKRAGLKTTPREPGEYEAEPPKDGNFIYSILKIIVDAYIVHIRAIEGAAQ